MAPPRPAPARSRSEQRSDEARAALEPLAPGERPLAVTIGALVAMAIGVANLVLFLSGYEVRGRDTKPIDDFQAVSISVLMLVMGAFMWRSRYWAVLGFEALLALTCIVAGMSLLVASNAQAVLLCVAILAGAGTLFWFLVRAMARLQMPERPGARRTG